MLENEFIINVSKKLNISYKESKDIINIILECIAEELIKGGKVKLIGFGSFEVVRRAARKGHNPHTKKIFDIPSCNEPTFKAGKMLKELVNKN